MSDPTPINGKKQPDEALEPPAPEPGSPEHILGMIADQLNVLLANDVLIGQGIAMILSGVAQHALKRDEVIEMIKKLDPSARFEPVSNIYTPH